MSPEPNLENLSLEDLRDRYGLERVSANPFFSEWRENLPEISDMDKLLLARIRQSYFNLMDHVPCMGRPIQTIVVAPLLFLGNFFTSPFKVQEEAAQAIEVEDDGILFKGQLVTFSITSKFKLMLVESEDLALPMNAGLSPMLSFMLHHLQGTQPLYGVVVAASNFIFLKMQRQAPEEGDSIHFALSEAFSIWGADEEFYRVFQIVKHFGYLPIAT